MIPAEKLLVAADHWADQILTNTPLALRLTKLALCRPPGAHPNFDNVAQAVLFEAKENSSG